jgi:hypothetical protein
LLISRSRINNPIKAARSSFKIKHKEVQEIKIL